MVILRVRVAAQMYVIVWEFIVATENKAQFEAVYGPEGEWAKLFASSEGYLQTQLLRDTSNLQRYLTLDLWTSRQAHEDFRSQNAAEYQALDARCECLTMREAKLGDFESS
jgi:heme-degrading monooxygenase HmoA